MSIEDKQVAIIDSGGHNINSIVFAFERLEIQAELTADWGRIERATHVVLPGVGSAGAAMRALSSTGLHELIPRLTQPVLGICLGMHLLFERSEEDDTECLGIIDGVVRQIPRRAGLTVPHMGWNQTQAVRCHPLLSGLPQEFEAYFVHSYAAPLGSHTLGKSLHGEWFSSMVNKQQFMGIQFHPERSGPVGLQLLNNFLHIEINAIP